MTKAEIASYLTSLLTLMEAQDTSGVHNRSAVLADEYNKHWDLLKSVIKQEQADETRKRDKLSHGSDKARYADGENQPRRSGADRDRPERSESSGAHRDGQGSAGALDDLRKP